MNKYKQLRNNLVVTDDGLQKQIEHLYRRSADQDLHALIKLLSAGPASHLIRHHRISSVQSLFERCSIRRIRSIYHSDRLRATYPETYRAACHHLAKLSDHGYRYCILLPKGVRPLWHRNVSKLIRVLRKQIRHQLRELDHGKRHDQKKHRGHRSEHRHESNHRDARSHRHESAARISMNGTSTLIKMISKERNPVNQLVSLVLSEQIIQEAIHEMWNQIGEQ